MYRAICFYSVTSVKWFFFLTLFMLAARHDWATVPFTLFVIATLFFIQHLILIDSY